MGSLDAEPGSEAQQIRFGEISSVEETVNDSVTIEALYAGMRKNKVVVVGMVTSQGSSLGGEIKRTLSRHI